MRLATTLRNLRGVRGFTQEELATLAGVSPTTVVDIEAGRIQRPQAPTLGKLAAALGVNIFELAGEDRP
jgi:transcriptional regulator with XRE-family HTH domain